jgi:hypothetical protein
MTDAEARRVAIVNAIKRWHEGAQSEGCCLSHSDLIGNLSTAIAAALTAPGDESQAQPTEEL